MFLFLGKFDTKKSTPTKLKLFVKGKIKN